MLTEKTIMDIVYPNETREFLARIQGMSRRDLITAGAKNGCSGDTRDDLEAACLAHYAKNPKKWDKLDAPRPQPEVVSDDSGDV